MKDNNNLIKVTKSEKLPDRIHTTPESAPEISEAGIDDTLLSEGTHAIGFLDPATSSDIVDLIQKEVKNQLKQLGIGLKKELVIMSKAVCKITILEEIEKHPEGFYPSDIALKYSLDFDFVDECFEELEADGKIKGN